MSNDFVNYPDDSFENMIKFSKDNNFNFPYFMTIHKKLQSLMMLYAHLISLVIIKTLSYNTEED